jgi:chromosome segregation ATPase
MQSADPMYTAQVLKSRIDELTLQLDKAKHRINELEGQRLDKYTDKFEHNAGRIEEANKRIADLEESLCRIANGYDDEEEGSANYYPAYKIAMEALNLD